MGIAPPMLRLISASPRGQSDASRPTASMHRAMDVTATFAWHRAGKDPTVSCNTARNPPGHYSGPDRRTVRPSSSFRDD